MKPEIARQLEALLDKRDQEKRESKIRASEQQNTEAKNLADFAATAHDLINPAFQEIAKMYEARGVSVPIVEEAERKNPRGGTESPSVRLDMAGAYGHSDMKPQFKLIFNKRDRKLTLFTSTQNQSGSAGDILLDDLTADWIHQAFVKYATGKF